ncbi:MAG: response regulator [Sphingomonas sp.]|nr:response regulator [Sphingomonas sp.]
MVEDEPLIAFDTEHFLQDDGFEIVGTVDNVGDAVEMVRSGAPIDLVLADINLADGSGIDVARAAHAAGIPVLFVTGQCPEEARALADGSLAKPYAQRDLLASIAAIDAMRGGLTPKRVPSGLELFKRID